MAPILHSLFCRACAPYIGPVTDRMLSDGPPVPELCDYRASVQVLSQFFPARSYRKNF